jgi:hypothetical protein
MASEERQRPAVEEDLAALGSPEAAYDHAAFSGHSSGATVTSLEPLFPKR